MNIFINKVFCIVLDFNTWQLYLCCNSGSVRHTSSVTFLHMYLQWGSYCCHQEGAQTWLVPQPHCQEWSHANKVSQDLPYNLSLPTCKPWRESKKNGSKSAYNSRARGLSQFQLSGDSVLEDNMSQRLGWWIMRGNVLVQSIHPRPTTSSAGDLHSKIKQCIWLRERERDSWSWLRPLAWLL